MLSKGVRSHWFAKDLIISTLSSSFILGNFKGWCDFCVKRSASDQTCAATAAGLFTIPSSLSGSGRLLGHSTATPDMQSWRQTFQELETGTIHLFIQNWIFTRTSLRIHRSLEFHFRVLGLLESQYFRLDYVFLRQGFLFVFLQTMA